MLRFALAVRCITVRHIACSSCTHLPLPFLPLHFASNQYSIHRYYSKGKGIHKSKKGAVIDRGDAIDPLILDVQTTNESFEACISQLKEQLTTQLSLRSNIRAYEDLPVKVHDGDTEITRLLNHLARISLKNPQLIVINCSQNPAYVKAIKIAIEQSALNVNPQTEGNLLYVPIPPVTKQRREELAKKAKLLFNKCNESLSKEYGLRLKQIHLSTDKIGKKIAEEHLLKMKNEFRDLAQSITDSKAKELLQQKM